MLSLSLIGEGLRVCTSPHSPGRFLGQVFWACPNGMKARSRPMTCWRHFISQVVKEHFGVPKEGLKDVAKKREV